MPKEFSDRLTLQGKIYSAQGRFELDHENGQLTLEFQYFEAIPVVWANLEFLSADLERAVRHCAFRLPDLPLLLTRAGQVLRESMNHAESGKEKSAPG